MGPAASRLAESLSPGTDGVLWNFRQLPVSSESAFKQAVTPTPGGTHLLGPKPLHHVAGVSPMPAGQAEIGRSSNCHVADGTLECEAFADGALCATDLAPAVAAVHAKLCKRLEMAKTRDTSLVLQKQTGHCELRKIFILGLCRTPIRPVIFDFLVLNSRTPSSTVSSVIKRSCCHCSGRMRGEGPAGAWLS